MLLVVAESSGSSPGRTGYKMAVGNNGDLYGSIGGGVMEVNLGEKSRAVLSEAGAIANRPFAPHLIEQVHQKNAPNASGMICSGRQTIILVPFTSKDSQTVATIINALKTKAQANLSISHFGLEVTTDAKTGFSKQSEAEFTYTVRLGLRHELYIVGGGHCSLALSELMSKLDFRITIFDDRPELNTIEKNRFADEIRIIENYEQVGDLVPSGAEAYVVVMTLGYASDEIAVRALLGHDLKYFGVLGSKAKMAILLRTLKREGAPKDVLSRIHTPIGLPINSHTPAEIAVSIAAEIISIKNAQ